EDEELLRGAEADARGEVGVHVALRDAAELRLRAGARVAAVAAAAAAPAATSTAPAAAAARAAPAGGAAAVELTRVVASLGLAHLAAEAVAVAKAGRAALPGRIAREAAVALLGRRA